MGAASRAVKLRRDRRSREFTSLPRLLAGEAGGAEAVKLFSMLPLPPSPVASRGDEEGEVLIGVLRPSPSVMSSKGTRVPFSDAASASAVVISEAARGASSIGAVNIP